MLGFLSMFAVQGTLEPSTAMYISQIQPNRKPLLHMKKMVTLKGIFGPDKVYAMTSIVLIFLTPHSVDFL
ncbi:hypothetical protein D3C83_197500 [compost metagenome]